MNNNTLIRNKLAIFDLDGTLFDTKNVNYAAYSQAMKECGISYEIDYQYYCKFCNGNSYKVFLPQIVPGISDVDMQKIHEAKNRIYKNFLGKAKKNIHLFSIINLMKEQYQIAIVTTASRVNTEDILYFFDAKDVFDFIITQEDVERTKPAPDGFIQAMNKADVSAEDTIIFEDSEAGLEAAAASGAKYVKIYGYN